MLCTYIYPNKMYSEINMHMHAKINAFMCIQLYNAYEHRDKHVYAWKDKRICAHHWMGVCFHVSASIDMKLKRINSTLINISMNKWCTVFIHLYCLPGQGYASIDLHSLCTFWELQCPSCMVCTLYTIYITHYIITVSMCVCVCNTH